jgi:hypothetical protein
MAKSIVKLDLKYYEELKKYKDNFDKSFIAKTKETDYYDSIDIHFHSEEEMNKILIEKILKLEDKILDKNKELAILEVKLNETAAHYEKFKSFGIFDFLKLKKHLKKHSN